MTHTATIYRMKLPDHECPYGLLAKRMLEDAGYRVDDHLLTSREQVDAYMASEGVDTTPQVFIDGRRIGGSEQVAEYLERADAGQSA
jgi:glutaredoxin 3